MSLLVHESVRLAASRTPEHAAVVLGDVNVSYRELNDRSNQLANTLETMGVAKGDRVGLFVHKSIETVVGVYGIMKAGAVFVPIDPQSPAERVGLIIDDCDIEIVITERRKLGVLDTVLDAALESSDGGLRAVVSDGDDAAHGFSITSWDEVTSASVDEPTVVIDPDDLAYIMYTSGSTGVPKGMMHSHRSSLGFGRWGVDHCELVPSDRVASHGPLHFDISIFDIFSTGLAGATVVLVPEPVTKFAASFSQLLADQAVTALFTVPFAFIQLVTNGALHDRDLAALRWVLFGGEPFPARHLAALMEAIPAASYSNVYGPAEAPACVTHTVAEAPDESATIPIGRPSPHTEVLVVEPGGNHVVNIGEVGELLVASPSITLGYWNRPERNAASYFHDDGPGGTDLRYFRTGDLVRVGADGVYDFLGRSDRMVKTRGFRVELDEIEAALSSHPGVIEAAAFTSQDDDGVVLVHAAFTSEFTDIADSDVMAHAVKRLPNYALPVTLRREISFPRTTSDKIDRTALAETHRAKKIAE